MDGSTVHQQLEKMPLDIERKRREEDKILKNYQGDGVPGLQKDMDQKLETLRSDAKADVKELYLKKKDTADTLNEVQQRELAELRAKHRAQNEIQQRELAELRAKHRIQNEALAEATEHAHKRLKDKQEADKKRIRDTYEGQISKTKVDIGTGMKHLQEIQTGTAHERCKEDSIKATEQSQLNSKVETPAVASRPGELATQPPQRRLDSRKTLSVSAVAALSNNPARGNEQFEGLSSVVSHTQFPEPQSRPQENMTPTKRRISDGADENEIRTPPSLRQSVSDNKIPAGDGEYSKSSNILPSPSTLLSHNQTPPTASTARADLISSTPPQSKMQSVQQATLLSRNRGKAICENFEIVSVRYNHAIENYPGGEFYTWTRDHGKKTRYMRLTLARGAHYIPVVKHGKKSGSVEWHIQPTQVHWLKYDAHNSLIYLNRREIGKAGNEMWIVFKDEDSLNGFLKSYRENWPLNKVETVGPDDHIPMSLRKKQP